MLRLATWSSGTGLFRKKAKYIAAWRPDVLVVQEEKHDDSGELSGATQPTFRDWMAVPPPGGGIGVYSYTDTKLTRVTSDEPSDGFHRYEAQHGDLRFQMAAVWVFYAKEKETRYMQLHAGLRRHREWMRQAPTVVMGDFNINASFNAKPWDELMELIEPLGLVSVYHRHFGEEYGEETQPTHVWEWSEDATFHTDYIFVPEAWAGHITKVEVGEYSYWHNLSGHMPVIVDLEL